MKTRISSKKLEYHMRAQNLSKAALAEMAGTSRMQIYRLLSGEEDAFYSTTLDKLAVALDVFPFDLLEVDRTA
jgi:DNA-binding Xre family transcriptional regulator